MNESEDKKVEEKKFGKEIMRLIEKLHDKNIFPSVHGTKLILFGEQHKELIRFIQDFSVIKNPRYIRQILLWKLNRVAQKKEKEEQKSSSDPMDEEELYIGRPLSGIDPGEAETLYNCIFDQAKFLKELKEKKQPPMNIVLFRRGTSGQHLTNILKTLDNINTTILVSGTDDSKSWYNGATLFNAPGLPSAGKAILALANDWVVKEFLSMRISGKEDDIIRLVERLRKPSMQSISLDKRIRPIFNAFMRISGEKREEIADYLNEFSEEYENFIDSDVSDENSFPLSNIPLRSLVILGAYLSAKRICDGKKPVSWQSVIDKLSNKIAKISTKGKENRILFLTDERQRLVALDEDGFLYLSEIAIKNKTSQSKFLGLWLLNSIIDRNFVRSFIERCEKCTVERKPVLIKGKLAQIGIKDEYERYKSQILDTTWKIEGTSDELNEIAGLIAEMSSSDERSKEKVSILKDAKKALQEADLILYSDRHIETSVGAALIVPGAAEAIKANKTGIKICLSQGDEKSPLDNLESVLRCVTGRMKYKEDREIDWRNEKIDDYVDFVIRSIYKYPSQGSYKDLFKKPFSEMNVFTQYYNSDIKPEHGTYPAKSLSEIIIGLLGVHKAGFIADQKFGLLKKSYINQDSEDKYCCAALGLFQTDSIEKFVEQSRRKYFRVMGKGGFVFDVDMTLLPKKAKALTDYPSLAYYILLLLRDEHKVGIISGNSAEEQIPRIEDAIREEMTEYESSLKNLTFYVDGGATKIGYDENGKSKGMLAGDFNQKHAMEYDKLKEAVDNALKKIHKEQSFNLNEAEKKEFMKEAEEKYPKFNLKAPWDHEEWEPVWITPTDLIKEYEETGKSIIVPWIELRGQRDGMKKVASIAIKPTPQLKSKDIRGLIQNTIKDNLGEDKKDKYLPRSGGTSTTDITLKNADKTAALNDFIKSNGLTYKRVYYFGDEFYFLPGNNKDENEQTGNDEAVALAPTLEEVNTIAVNMDHVEGAHEKTKWIGRSPQAVLEFLEQIILD